MRAACSISSGFARDAAGNLETILRKDGAFAFDVIQVLGHLQEDRSARWRPGHFHRPARELRHALELIHLVAPLHEGVEDLFPVHQLDVAAPIGGLFVFPRRQHNQRGAVGHGVVDIAAGIGQARSRNDTDTEFAPGGNVIALGHGDALAFVGTEEVLHGRPVQNAVVEAIRAAAAAVEDIFDAGFLQRLEDHLGTVTGEHAA